MSKENIYIKRVSKLRELMRQKNIEAFLVTHDDEHLLENTSKSFERLKWIIGFSGSAGYLLITLDELFLFVDSRYSIQSKIETKGLKIKIFNVFELNYEKFISLNKLKAKNLALDPKTMSQKLYSSYQEVAIKYQIKILKLKKNLIDYVWIRSLKVQNTKDIFILKQKYSGMTFTNKLNKLFAILKQKNVDWIFLQNSESVAWLFNIRGMDLPYTPITFAYSLISKKYIYIFLEDPVLPKKILDFYSKKVRFVNFLEINQILKKMKVSKQKIIVDQSSTSKYYYDLLRKHYKKVFNDADPVCYLKSIKNKVEIKNLVKSHIFDGVALTKFIYWFKNIKNKVSELDIVNKIDSLRQQNQEYLSKSFPTIAGSGKNGAIVHYIPNKKSNRKLNSDDILLLDSGGQYKLGTTDVTRTLSIGKAKKIQSLNYTLVLKSHIKLNNAIFPKGTSGAFLDYIARSELWKSGKDFAHGTGHGVGYCLNVHEGPFSISKNNNIPLQEGMVFSNEPGYYLEGKFGIRIENLVTIKKKTINKKELFKIETLTLAPYDIDLITKSLLTNEELIWIKNYHNTVFKKISPYLDKNEKSWLFKEINKL